MNAVDTLEAAKELLEQGDAVGALRRLGSGSIPGFLREEADFLAAEAWRSRGFFGRAEALYRKTLGRPAKLDPPLRVEAALGSAAGLRSVGEVPAARRRLADAVRTARVSRLRAYARAIELEDALIDRAAGAYGKSLGKLSAILRTATAERDWAKASFVLWAMGGAFRFKGELAASRAAFERSLSLAGRAGDVSAKGYALFGLGGVTRIMGRLKESATFYRRAARVFRGTQDVFGLAYAECGYANALRQVGRWAEAERRYKRAHFLYSQLGDEPDLGYVDWGLGQVYLRRGDLRRATASFLSALSLFKRHHEERGTALSELSLSHAYHALGRTAAAERLFDAARDRSRRNGLHAHLEIYT
ncbi:MAG: tetratricopeptide repeat protein [Elusimicrobia bacterium]|nr:tetratricopeptide repeat protein [Elusimicrobiota bacterium]